MPTTIQVQHGSSNGKLTGGKRREDVWTASPYTTLEDGERNAYGTCPPCPMLPRAEHERRVADDLPVADDWTGGCYTTGRTGRYAIETYGETTTFDDLLADVLAEQPTLVRYGVVGDYGRTDDERSESVAGLIALRDALADHDGHLITYTHGWRVIGEAPDPAMNASCDTLEDVDRARSLGWQPVIVGPEDIDGSRAVARETGGVVCPAADPRSDVAGCVGCGGASGPLCARDRRGASVVFPAHGVSKDRLATDLLEGLEDRLEEVLAAA